MSARSRFAQVVAAMLLGALVLSGCAGLPRGGPVNAGGSIAELDGSEPNIAYVPQGPTAGATPQQIIEGFILAASGSRDGWSVAQEFLAPEFASVWRPEAGVIVYVPGSRTPVAPGTDGAYTLSVTSQASVDATGVYTAEAGRAVPLSFHLAQQADGEWRITSAPDGLVLDANRFASVFSEYALMYFDPTGEYLVPDVRWFPVTNAVTSIAVALVNGQPSPLLAGGVRTAFTGTAGLAQSAVPQNSGVAQVSLLPAARDLEQRVLDRMQTQLQASLATAGVERVDMVVDGEVLGASAVTTDAARVDTRLPLALVGDQFGFASEEAIESVPGLSGVIAAQWPRAIEVNPDLTAAALQLPNGSVSLVTDVGVVWNLDQRPELIAPTMDAQGRVWSVPRNDPTAVIVYDSGGAPLTIGNAWPGATAITAMRVSRDGTRVAAVVQDGTTWAVWVASIQRDEDGIPVSLGERVRVTSLEAGSPALSWLGASAVVVASSVAGEPVVIEQPIGGPREQLRAPGSVVGLMGGNTATSVRLLTSEGEIFERRGGTWIASVSGVSVLAMQRGTPD